MGLKSFLGKLIDDYLESETMKLQRVSKHGGALELKGYYGYKTARVYLYGIELTKDKICEAYGWEPEDVYFSWGDAEDMGGFYLSCAILLEVYNKDRAYRLAKQFNRDFISHLPKGDFEELFNIQVWFTNRVPREPIRHRGDIEKPSDLGGEYDDGDGGDE